FLAVNAVIASNGSTTSITLDHAAGDNDRVQTIGTARIGRSVLRKIRPDLSVPEVRSSQEWSLFQSASERGTHLDDSAGPWRLKIVREVDMTRDRGLLNRDWAPGRMPLIEGRMVQHFRHNAKAYGSGSGRRALWETVPLGESDLSAQFWVD